MTLPKIFEIKNYPAKSAFTICLIFILGIIIGELIIETGFTRYYYSNKWMYYFIVFSWFATIYLALIFYCRNNARMAMPKRTCRNSCHKIQMFFSGSVINIASFSVRNFQSQWMRGGLRLVFEEIVFHIYNYELRTKYSKL